MSILEAIHAAPSKTAQVLVELQSVCRTYTVRGGDDVRALRPTNLALTRGGFSAIMGPSGSGKSTLLNILGCLDTPSCGRYFLDGADVAQLGVNARAALRLHHIGFVFQSFHLLPRLSALENIMLPLAYAGVPVLERKERARELLEKVGVAARAAHRPAELSGGQQQRVAIARALANHPKLLLADEPTGALDSRTSADIMALLRTMTDAGLTMVVITHDASIAGHADQVLSIRDGVLRAQQSYEPASEWAHG